MASSNPPAAAEQLLAQLAVAPEHEAKRIVARLIALDDGAVPALIAALRACYTQMPQYRPAPGVWARIGRALTAAHPQPAPVVAARIKAALQGIGAAAVAPLAELLHNKTAPLWNDTVSALGAIETPQSMLVLLEEVRAFRTVDRTLRLLHDDGSVIAEPELSGINETWNPYSRWGVLAATLSSIAYLPGLLRLLDDADPYLRQFAVEVLGGLAEYRDRALIGHLLPLLSDNDAFVRIATAAVLAELRDATTAPAFMAALADPQPAVRWLAARALGTLPDARALDVLSSMQSDAHELPAIRAAAAVALAQLRSG